MKHLILFIFTLFNIYSIGLEGLKIEHGLILDKNGLYTGKLQKENMESNVELGVITDFMFINKGKILFEVEVEKNKFNGNGIIYHGTFGQIDAIYEDGFLKSLKCEEFYEKWQENIFIEGHTKNSLYKNVSKNPYVEFFDKYSFNIVQNFFDVKLKNNGVYNDKNSKYILNNGIKIKKYYNLKDDMEVSVPLGDYENYIISITNMSEGKLYQGKIVSGNIEAIIFSDLNGPAMIEEYKHGIFSQGRSLRNALVYKQNQLEQITNIIKDNIK